MESFNSLADVLSNGDFGFGPTNFASLTLSLVLAFLNQAAYWILPFAAAGLLLQIFVGPFGRYLRGA